MLFRPDTSSTSVQQIDHSPLPPSPRYSNRASQPHCRVRDDPTGGAMPGSSNSQGMSRSSANVRPSEDRASHVALSSRQTQFSLTGFPLAYSCETLQLPLSYCGRPTSE
jgi:hypothetical protein